MTRDELQEFVDTEIKAAAQRIIDKTSKSDEVALGKLTVLLSLQRVLDNKGTPEDLGMLGVINHVLQHLRVLNTDETFLDYAGERPPHPFRPLTPLAKLN